MRFRLLAAAALVAAAGCNTDTTTCCSLGMSQALRLVNAFTTPIQVTIDGKVVATALTPGAIDTVGAVPGSHSVALRSTTTSTNLLLPLTTTAALSTVALVRTSTASLDVAVLDDTNEVVPAGATKLRVIHFAPNAGTLQVYRTQPDFQTPISWQFPFNYQDNPTSLSAPFLQSTVGTWEVHIWQTPADSSGWSTAPVKVLVPLASGEKRTILILDAVGGGVRVQVI